MKLYSRYELPKLLLQHDIKYGIELGVGNGKFASHLLTNYNFKRFYGVDSYADHHDVRQYKKWLRKSQKFSNYTLLRTTFDEALDFFENNFLDFIFYDGYDYSVDILNSWFLKLKQNGIFFGRCYEEKWPRDSTKTTPGNSVIDTNLFIEQHNLQLNIIEETPDKTIKVDKSTKRSWYIIKP